MTQEEQLIRDNAPFIRGCAISFMRDRDMPYNIYAEDVYQEAAVAYIGWHRKLEAGHYRFGGEKFARTAIRYHLQRAFINQRGIKRNHDRPCDVRIVPEARISDERRWELAEDRVNDYIYKADIARWTATLIEEDRAMVCMILRGYSPGDIERRLNKKPYQYRYQKERIGKSYLDYFGEAG